MLKKIDIDAVLNMCMPQLGAACRRGSTFVQSTEGELMSIKTVLIMLVIALAAVWASNNVTFVKNIVG